MMALGNYVSIMDFDMEVRFYRYFKDSLIIGEQIAIIYPLSAFELS